MISGATKEQARAALQAAFGDPNRAFEYLAGGFTGALGVGAGAGFGGAGMDARMMDDEYGEEEDEGSVYLSR